VLKQNAAEPYRATLTVENRAELIKHTSVPITVSELVSGASRTDALPVKK